MIVINVKESDTLDKALKKFKKKYEKTGVVKELRSRQAFEKPCITKRMQKIRAAYKLQMQRADTEG
jgi:small subunit ribosomal protein S21